MSRSSITNPVNIENMSSTTNPVNIENMLVTQYSFSQVFLGDNTFNKEIFKNTSGGTAQYGPGTVVGRIAADGTVTQCVTTAVDGSATPIGILASATGELAADGTTSVSVCDFGEVAAEKLIFNGSDTLSTVFRGVQMRDYIAGNSRGIKLITSTELTGLDNA